MNGYPIVGLLDGPGSVAQSLVQHHISNTISDTKELMI